jgi:hypothetical protein
MSSKRVFTPATSWTAKLDYEHQQEHDFCNLVQEFFYAVTRQDQRIMEYCEAELKRMYRDRRPKRISRKSALAV